MQFRQTGISLKVKPRISSNGMVFMEITQDVSSPGADGPVIGGNISVDNRKLHTEVAVQSGETIVLAGLIKTEQGKGSGGVPVPEPHPGDRRPVRQQDVRDNRAGNPGADHADRDPRPEGGARLTDEYGARFRALEPLRKAAGAEDPRAAHPGDDGAAAAHGARCRPRSAGGLDACLAALERRLPGGAPVLVAETMPAATRASESLARGWCERSRLDARYRRSQEPRGLAAQHGGGDRRMSRGRRRAAAGGCRRHPRLVRADGAIRAEDASIATVSAWSNRGELAAFPRPGEDQR